MTEYLQAIATVLSLINPAICAAMFSDAEAGLPGKSQFADATRTMLTVLVILALAAFFGTDLLRAFGISLDAFQVAGGAVLVWMGFTMLSGGNSNSPLKDTTQSVKPGLSSLVLFAASPGTITGVITLSAAHSPMGIPLTSLVAVGVAITFTWMILLLTIRFAGRMHGGGPIHDITTRFMGLIVLAMGVQFALTGVRAFMAVQ
jgi:multiple antibiotic resistance protein